MNREQKSNLFYGISLEHVKGLKSNGKSISPMTDRENMLEISGSSRGNLINLNRNRLGRRSLNGM